MSQSLFNKPQFNKVYVGLLISLATTMVAYAVVTLIFELLASAQIIDDPIGEGVERMNRTVWLIAICCNIIGIQYFSKRRSANVQRGIAFLTVIAAGIWIFYFKDSLFVSE